MASPKRAQPQYDMQLLGSELEEVVDPTITERMTEMQRRFVAAYCSDPERNATRAYIAAGFRSARPAPEAARLKQHPAVAAAIQAFEANELRRIRERAGVSLLGVLTSIARCMYYDPRKVFDANGAPLPIQELDDDTALAIEGVEVLEQFEGSGEDKRFVGYVKKYKFAKRSAAQDMLMKHLNGYKADNDSKAEAVANGLVALLGEMRRSALPVVQQVNDGDQAL